MTVEPFLYLALATLLALLWALFWIGLTHLRFHQYHRREGIPYPPLGLSGWALFYLRTVRSILLLFWWGVRSLFSPRLRRPDGPVTGPPVLCVHGFHMSGASMWGIRRTLERHGRPTRALYLGLAHHSPEHFAQKLAQRWRSLLAEAPAERIDVVAHSMGGLVVRLALVEEPTLARSLRRIVTLGAPHHGTGLLRWIPFGSAYRTMRRDAPFLRRLPPFAHTAPAAEVTTVATAHDLLVYPVETAHLEGARQVTLERVGHLGLLTDREVRERVAQLLSDGGGGPRSSPS